MKPQTRKPAYFNIPELPSQLHFYCDRLRATLSTDACGERWKTAAEAITDVRWITCKKCRIGAWHAGKIDDNPSSFKAVKICARCHVKATRLIGKHLCLSCYNRQREQLVGKNAKGKKPSKLPPLRSRSISYSAGSKFKTKTIDRSLDVLELIVAVLRDEDHSVRFGWQAPAAMQALLQLKEVGV
ncbi:hypothetical protein PQQ65_03460 [Paraburkholderia strydomiana]|uniref:hypothetical protein n=1 Tax=Paraburkholderia strydomiana TaxID=1245417 RepID=UPI0038BAFEC5